ncbi:MAG: 3-methyl-2-oxobutanoate dehydrogenase subunit VorB [Lachnospirales bacterium]
MNILKTLLKGNEAVGHGALLAGCKAFFGYPITPQNEIPEFMAKMMPKNEGVYVQAESEVAAINMLFGGAGAGVRSMTSSSSPGIALKQEGITYIAGAEVPCVIVSISRSGPGLGGITPSQADYFQSTRGGGNGDYFVPVLTPNSAQELLDFTQKAFYLSDKYRTPVMVLADGALGQMMEPVEIRKLDLETFDKTNIEANGEAGKRGKRNIVSSLYLVSEELEAHNTKLEAKKNEIIKNEVAYEFYNMEKPEIVVCAYGVSSRIVMNAIDMLKKQGVEVGLVRPLLVNPFPYDVFQNLPDSVKSVMAIELSRGQMIQDVKLGVNGKYPVNFYGRCGGMIFDEDELVEAILKTR